MNGETKTTPASGSFASANLLCGLSMLIWAAGLVAAEPIIPLLSPEHLNAVRMALAALTLLPIWVIAEGWRPLADVNWLKGIAVGSLIGLGAWFLVLGQARSGPVTVAVISATMPVIGITLEVLLDGRRITKALCLGLILSVVGGVVALDLRSGGFDLGLGALFCFASVLSFTIGSRMTVTAFPQQSPVGRTTVTLVGASIATALVVAMQSASGTPLPAFTGWGLREVGALLLFSVGAVGIAQLLWIMAIGHLGIGVTAFHMNTTPFYVMLILFALGQAWDWKQAIAAGIVALGVLIAQGIIPLPERRQA